ncbi:hypothetical protein [Chitiniphilus eburneus]|uniref:Uncharacterized protein n=1 Tax=Chitiniphilus eburneus TaxID=2571148 RepID=A0A4U0PYF5_9NEIS|nr:hypothetical protein [Chitiniphilus eburneus]TJZ73579.1 hypothetical protein FAZ21_10365 [Chitiniphilus eburneus]
MTTQSSSSHRMRGASGRLHTRRMLGRRYGVLTALVVPRVRHAVGAVLTVALLAAVGALCFVGEYRFGYWHGAIGALAVLALLLQGRHLRRERSMTRERDQVRETVAMLDVIEGEAVPPRLHQPQPPAQRNQVN